MDVLLRALQVSWTVSVLGFCLMGLNWAAHPRKTQCPLSRPDGLREEVGTMTCPSRCFLEDILP